MGGGGEQEQGLSRSVSGARSNTLRAKIFKNIFIYICILKSSCSFWFVLKNNDSCMT